MKRSVFPAQSSIALTQVTEWNAGHVHRVDDALAVEEPLEIRIASQPFTVTMRTPGHDRELAAGLLLSEGLIDEAAQLLALEEISGSKGRPGNAVDVQLSEEAHDAESVRRALPVSSGCGLCGRASIEAIRRRGLRAPNPDLRIDPELLCSLPERLRAQQQVFSRTGGLHAAALFNAAGELLVVREDIGRHNAVDKVIGWALLEGRLPLSQHVLTVSGRGGFEIAQKALAAGIPVLASVSAPSSLAVQLARELGLTLVGFVRGRRFVIYAGADRCLAT